MLVRSHNEWDPLEEVVVGTARTARVPRDGPDVRAIDYPDVPADEPLPCGPLPEVVRGEAEDDLDDLAEVLASLGVRVRRPAPAEAPAPFSNGWWTTDGYHAACPRDSVLVVGDRLIEAPMVLRSRQFEVQALRPLLLEYEAAGARWISAPRPLLADDLYDLDAAPGARLRDHEPVFDAANVVRLGRDLLYLVSDSGNGRGAAWLERALDGEYRVHRCAGIYARTHVDSTIVPIRPGLVLLNPERVNDANMPEYLEKWDKLWCPPLVDIGYAGDRPACSIWIGMNLLMVRPDLALVDDRQLELARHLERAGVGVQPCRLRHARTIGGGLHCCTLDIRRGGELEDYG
ncbi:MAG: scyllo-inosamine-4-phosphate amidinotransferase 1 [Acidimicrobiaceae bacterium]|nr:scyllo-inosamine-4-phosphate amidinotransferase 1 [Acidimicrobiaceae bacterium]